MRYTKLISINVALIRSLTPCNSEWHQTKREMLNLEKDFTAGKRRGSP